MEKLVIGNLKMNLLSAIERERYLKAFKNELKGKKLSRINLVLCPPFVHLEAFKKAHLGKKVSIGAQDMFWERSGSFTGEISPAMLKDAGCEYVILGHSERRRYFSENDEEVKMKVSSALKNGLKPVICVGESKVERSGGQAARVVGRQVRNAISGLNRTQAENIIIAYEPVWAVGSDILPTSNEIMEAKVLIRKILVELFDKKYAGLVKIIYGGSVNSHTAREACVDPAMDGALIGRESLTPFEFLKIAEIINT